MPGDPVRRSGRFPGGAGALSGPAGDLHLQGLDHVVPRLLPEGPDPFQQVGRQFLQGHVAHGQHLDVAGPEGDGEGAEGVRKVGERWEGNQVILHGKHVTKY